ncbi:MAG: DUF3124 domain-containing protein [Isosphaeraceae bacterium]
MMRERRRSWMLVVAASAMIVGAASCQQGSGPAAGPTFGAGKVARAGVAEISRSDLPKGGARGVQYVPVYSHVYTDDAARPFNVAVTLAVRNTDPAAPRFLASVAYFDSDGKLVREYAPGPLRVAPMAVAEFFVPQNDTAGGSSASFLVTWSAEADGAEPPMVEAVMVGTATNQVVSFTNQGRPVAVPAEGASRP